MAQPGGLPQKATGSKASPWKGVYPSLLTLAGLAVLAFVVYETMAFVTQRLGMEGPYWLVPLFGALGGATGALLRSERRIELCRYESPDRIDPGILGDLALGLGGAATVIFLFGGTLKFDPKNHDTYVILISVSFIAGASGKRILELAVKKLEDMAALKKELLVGTAGAEHYTHEARKHLDRGQLTEAMESVRQAIAADPKFVSAYVEKGRILKRMGKLEEALDTVEEGLKIEANNPQLLYNQACYECLLGRPIDEFMDGLGKAFAFQPKLAEEARNDPDFSTINGSEQFKQLLIEGH
jgi:tetratricopeptide (TPR) repeat protein